MPAQIRINKTPEIDRALKYLRFQKYPLLSESEIVKYLISQDYKTVSVDEPRSPEEKKEIVRALNKLYKEGDKLGKAFLAKKGLKREDLTENQLYELVKNA